MRVTRTYYNASSETLRIDYVSIELTAPIGKDVRLGNDPGLQMGVGPQKVETARMSSGVSLAGSRTITSIEIAGDYDDYDVAAPHNMTWATKTLGSGQVIRLDMSNLPKIGDVI